VPVWKKERRNAMSVDGDLQCWCVLHVGPSVEIISDLKGYINPIISDPEIEI